MKQLILLLALLMSLSAMADSCPPAKGLNPNNPPSGWQYLPSPDTPDYNYEFFSAIHYFTLNPFFKKIVCTYTAEGAPGVLTPRMLFISDKAYDQPFFSRTPPSPWKWSRRSEYTVFCQADGNNPGVCVFQ
jgi:hypothetical protein